MRIMTFARFFPAYHPKAGQPTYFVEKINAGLSELNLINDLCHLPSDLEWNRAAFQDCDPKYHTIRAGHRWKAGDYFSPRIWSGKAYRSGQVIIGPDIEIKKTWDIIFYENGIIGINGLLFSEHKPLAKNDGLSFEDFNAWFPSGKKFDGQIICWNYKIEY